MDNENFKKFLNLFLRSIFILFACLCTVQAAPLYSDPKEFYQNRSQTAIELVVIVNSAGKTDFVESNVALPKISPTPGSYADFSLNHYSALREYNQSILHCLKCISFPSLALVKLIATIQKKSIWHQSSDEDPLS